MAMAYAILRSGSKQYRVQPGDVIDVDRLPAEEGSSIELTDILAVANGGEVILGHPLVADASVIAQVRSHGKDKKIIVFKYKRKVRYRRKKGHRQYFTRLAITSILLAGDEIGMAEAPPPVLEEPAPEEDGIVEAVAVDESEEPDEVAGSVDELEDAEEGQDVAPETPEDQLDTALEAQIEEPDEVAGPVDELEDAEEGEDVAPETPEDEPNTAPEARIEEGDAEGGSEVEENGP